MLLKIVFFEKVVDMFVPVMRSMYLVHVRLEIFGKFYVLWPRTCLKGPQTSIKGDKIPCVFVVLI